MFFEQTKKDRIVSRNDNWFNLDWYQKKLVLSKLIRPGMSTWLNLILASTAKKLKNAKEQEHMFAANQFFLNNIWAIFS